MVLNVINGRMLASLYGQDCDKWAGKSVQVVSTFTDFGGKQTPCIRLRPPPGAPAITFAPAAAPRGQATHEAAREKAASADLTNLE